MDDRTTQVDVLEDSFRRYARREAIVCMGAGLRLADVDRLSDDLDAWLQSLGLAQGVRLALMMRNIPQHTVAMLRAGCAVVNINLLYTARKLEYQRVESGAEAIVVLENFAGTLEAMIDRAAVSKVVLASMGDLLGF